MSRPCVICDAPVAESSTGVTCSPSCAATFRERKMVLEGKSRQRQDPPELIERVRYLYVECNMTLAEVARLIGPGVRVDRILKRNGIPRRHGGRISNAMENNPQWRGDEVGYTAAHHRVKSLYGPVQERACIDCGQPAEHWSYVGGCPRERRSTRRGGAYYSPDPTRYVPRCAPCHRAYDYAGRRPNGQWISKRDAS